jgi:integrase
MGRTRTGSIVQKDKTWYGRLIFRDETGKRRERLRRADNRSDAREKAKELVREFEQHGERALDGSHLNFAQLAEFYKITYLIPAEYVDGRKIAGLRSASDMRGKLTTLQNHFSKQLVKTITTSDIMKFRASRLKAPTKHKKQRSIASVNRELALLRRILNVAQHEGWLIRNPFGAGTKVISAADERKVERILTSVEEGRLLEACKGPRAHLRPIIILAIDTGMRRGELLKLQWSDIDFENTIITVKAFNTKTLQERQVAMTPRVHRELSRLFQQTPSCALVFGIKDNFKNAFNSARKKANLNDVRFHDLCHTAATRLVRGHMPLSEVGRILGHTQANTTYRYVNADIETARKAAQILASLPEAQSPDEASS